ncbi:MAG: hypothetical protein QG636_684, partial [Patescibacteria group bacterium]|nr:hypothetical protein [Patescibacteria group bacterium]
LAATISDFASTAQGLFSSSATGLTYTSGTGAFSLTSGYNIPLTASTTEWSTAYLNRITSATSPLSIANNVISLSTAGDWTGTLDGQEGSYYLARANHTGTQLASTISDFSTTARGLFSSSATGLTYTSGTGAFSLTSGYEIPLTASTTNWNTFYDTPSSRITAGNALTWTGNTLAVSTTSLASGFFQQGGNSFGATAVLGTNDSNNLAFETGGSTRMTFDTSGNAGLGITVPNRTLSINGTLGFAESDGNSIWHVSSVSSALTFTKSGSFDALTISNGGNVGIGTTTPGSLLSVAGSAYASGFFNTSGITGGYKQNGTTILMASSTNFSILVGDGAGRLLDATGLRSTAVGHNALYTATSSDNNTAVGYYALRVTTSGQSNTVVGAQSLQANTTGSYNVALGDEVLLANTTGSFNTAIGSNTMRNANTGSRNFALGYGALSSNTGSDNAGIGYLALSTNTSGTDNTGIGYNAFGQNTTGSSNIGIGYTVALTNKTGTNNVAIGTAALYSNTSATSTVSIGYLAAYGSASYYNQGSVAIGYQAGRNFATGSDYNTLVGYKSGDGLTTGARNVLLGNSTIAASYNQVTTGSNNIAIGNDVAVPSATASNQLVIGNLIYGTGLSGTGATLSTGNVGIGTTSPNNKLHVYSGALEVSGAYASPLGSSVVLSQESTFAQLQSFASKPLSLNPLGNNVGIGTTTPNRALTVYSGSSQGAFQVENTSGAFVFGVDSLGGFAQPVTANKGMWFYDASGTGYMGINGATHNVGIGNAAPLSQLSNTATGDSIAGANATGFLWKSTANEWAAVVSSRPSSGNSYGLRTHASGTTASDYPFMVSSGAGAGTVHLVVTGAGNVGVGATAPGYKLEVGGTGYFGGKVAINSAALGSNSLDVFTNSPGSVAVFQNNAAAADNVLVGINSSSVTGAVEYLRGSGSATGNADIAVYNGGTGAARFRALAISTGDALATFDVNGGQAWSLGLDNSDSDSFKISGYNQLGINDYVTVKTSGNVGIGTTSPDALLTLSKAEGNTLINITNQSVAATPSQFKLRFDTSGNTIMENMRTAGGANQLVLGVTGNVGIGTTEPTGKLTIYDTTVGYPNPQIKLGYSAGLDYVIGRNNSTGFLQFVGNESTYSGFSFSTAAVANAVNIINNGNVGIGNSSPTYKLDIATSSAGTSNSLIRLKNTPTDALSGAGIEFNGYYNGGRIRGYSVSPGTVYTGGMQFDVNNVSNAWATAMTIQGDGNVGIGTTTPASTSYDIDQNLSITTKLHVSNAIRAEAGGFFIGHEENYASNQGGAHFTYDPVGNKAYIGGFKQGVGANALILQGNGGNVGIGTTGPGVKLDIQTTGANDAITRIGTTLSAANGSTAELHLSPASDYSISNDPRIYSYVDNSGTFSAGLRFDTFKSGVGRYNALTILGDGNVGIGTTSPQSLLHLAETSTAGSTLIIESNGASAVGAGIRLRHARGTVAAPTNTVAGDTTGLIAGQAYSGTGFLSTAEIDFLTESTAFTSGLRPASAISFYTNPANGSQTEQLRITSAGNVGIGTTTPSSLMHVAGSTGSALNYILEPTGWSGLKHRLGVQYSGDTPVFSNNTLLTSATAGTLDNTAQTGSALILGGSGSLNYVQASAGSGSRTFTSRVYIDSAGSVGISTTDPGAKLDVVTGINSAIQQWQGAGTNFKLKLTSGDGSVQDSVAYRLALDYLNGSYTNGFIDFYRGGDGASGFLTLGTANTERMRIDASGKVGVGTTLPLSKQHLAGSAQTATAGASDILTLERPFNNGVSFGRFGTIALGSADATSNGAGRMDFRLNPTSSGIAANPTVMPTLTTVLTLLGDGNVGIGTAAPDYTLHVRKDGDDSNPRLAITNTSTGTSARTSVQFINDTTGTAFVGVNGNGTGPGIGYPDALLAQTDKSAGLVFISGHASGIIRMVTGGTAGTNERLRIDASGNVGIGTTTPASTSGVNLTIGGIEPSIVLGSSAGAKTFSIASGGNYQYTPSSLVFHDNTAGATRMIINSTGNVGIGTTNPANFNLQVSASGSSWGGARIGLATIGSSGSGYPLIGDGIRFTSTGDSYLYDRNDTAAAIDFASGNIKFRTAVSGTAGNAITFSNRMTILNSNGNVGIGTTAPDNPLTIESNTNQLRLNSASDSSNYYATIGAQYNYSEAFVLKAFGGGSLRTLMSWSEPNGMALHSGNAPLILKTNDVERMRVSADGNVGIGTTTPAVAKLSVTTSGTKAIHLEGAYGSATPLTISTNYVGTPHVKTEIQFLNPSNGYGGGIAFATQPETLNAAVVERMRVGADGNIFVGTTTTGQYTSRLDIAFGGGGQEYGIELRPAVESTVAIAFQNAAGSNVGSISTGNSTTAYNTSSDRRLKENIVLSTRGIETLRRVGVQEYNFISDPGNRTQGYIAQDLYEVYPEAVHVGSDITRPWAVDYGRMTPLIVKSIQDLDLRTIALAPAAQNTQALSLIVSTDASIAGKLTVSGTSTFNDALTTVGSVTATAFLTETTETLPEEVYTGGKADLYKMGSYALSSAQESLRRTDLILDRLASIDIAIEELARFNDENIRIATSTTPASAISAIEDEPLRRAVSYITDLLTSGHRPLADFVAARVTAVQGYFGKVHADEICLMTTEGVEVCITGNELRDVLETKGIEVPQDTGTPPIAPPEETPIPEGESEEETIGVPLAPVVEEEPEPEPTPVPEPTSAPVPEPAPAP